MLALSGRLVFRLFTVCLALCAVLPFLAARAARIPADWEALGFSACQLPCFAGITPAETPFRDVSTLLMRHIPALDPRLMHSGSAIHFQAALWRTQDSPKQLNGLVRYDRGTTVSEVRVSTSVPLELVFAQLGAPDCILPGGAFSTQQSMVIFWERGAISVAAVLGRGENRVRLNGDAYALWLRAVNPPDCAMRGSLRWRGFAPVWAYNPARGG